MRQLFRCIVAVYRVLGNHPSKDEKQLDEMSLREIRRHREDDDTKVQ